MTSHADFAQWDLGEFDQKGSIATRWGTKQELLAASVVAHRHGVDILVDAVVNVRVLRLFGNALQLIILVSSCLQQHKLGGDRLETIPAVPVDPNNRLREIGKVRDIDVRGEMTVFPVYATLRI